MEITLFVDCEMPLTRSAPGIFTHEIQFFSSMKQTFDCEEFLNFHDYSRDLSPSLRDLRTKVFIL